MIKKIINNTIFRLFLGIALGLLSGSYLNENSIQVILSLKHILGQVIYFLIPMIVIGFVAASITKLSDNSSKVFGFALSLAYFASVAAELFSLLLGYQIIPRLSITNEIEDLKAIPEQIFRLDIPAIFSVMTALFLAFLLGLGALWTRSENIAKLLMSSEKS